MPVTIEPAGLLFIASEVATLNMLFVPVPTIESKPVQAAAPLISAAFKIALPVGVKVSIPVVSDQT